MTFLALLHLWFSSLLWQPDVDAAPPPPPDCSAEEDASTDDCRERFRLLKDVLSINNGY